MSRPKLPLRGLFAHEAVDFVVGKERTRGGRLRPDDELRRGLAEGGEGGEFCEGFEHLLFGRRVEFLVLRDVGLNRGDAQRDGRAGIIHDQHRARRS